jgi:tyrosine-protein kinase Etk/Wzc
MEREGLRSAPVMVREPVELDLFGFALLLLRHVWFILACGVVAFLLMVVDMLHAKPRYASTAVMIAPQGQMSTSSSLAAQLTGGGFDMGGGGDYQLYSDIMTSRTVEDRLIQDFDLKKVYGVGTEEAAEAILGSLTKVQTQHEGLIRVTVQDSNPKRAADLANDYLHQLDILNGQLVLTTVGEQRLYLEREMVKEKNALADAEVALKEVEESGTGLPPEALATAGLSALESTRAQLRAAQIHLDSLLVSETDQNPDVQRVKQEIAGLNAQLSSLQSGTASTENGLPVKQVPQQELVYTRRERDVKFHETLFDLLAKQYEETKQQEAKTPSVVQVLDPAVPSLHKAWPPRTYYCLLAAVGGVFAGIVLVALYAFFEAYTRNPRNAGKLEELKAVFRRSRTV